MENGRKNYLTNYVDMESNIVNPYGENIVSINLKLFHFFFLKIVKIDFKMKLQSFFLFGIFTKCLQNMTFHVLHLT